ncbi:MAG: Mur ligase family protein [Candidatus Taylorbacteria bacterium]
MINLPRKIHVIGICGVATSAIAIALKNAGADVTGSDKGFFPPVSTELEKHNIPYYAGWHPEKMIEGGIPDVVMIGAASGSQNPETIYAKEHGIPMLSYPEILGKYFVRDNSIVCSGTWGKTSSSALLSFILEKAQLNPSYMFGGVSLSHESSAMVTDSPWNVFEGDEYKSSPTDDRAKFFHYKPTHLLLSAVSWDHADLYPTEESYFEAFRKLLREVPENGRLVTRCDQPGINKIIENFTGKIITYGTQNTADFIYSDVIQSQLGLDFKITHDNKHYRLQSPMLGSYQAENITGCFAMAISIGIDAETVIRAISEFNGLKRRMEKRLDGSKSTKGISVIDDIAHSPEKASSVLSTLKDIYGSSSSESKGGKVIVIFEPNSGGRERQSAHKYDNAFRDADTVIIPRLTKLKVATDDPNVPIEGQELAEIIGKTQKNTIHIDDDEKLVSYILSIAKKGDVIAFLGSHGFRGMIEETIKNITII